MKTTALLLGIISLFAISSCKCDFDEDEPKNKYDGNNSGTHKNNSSTSENDTLRIK
ncbi:hypothetical protein [Chryseobacterium salviniae]|uniref:Lipoprotein n=1 Tax=Chryseobacterium salviniae TaxID=3101750 RepID=A0ABU6HVC0_9FLAO|nr:hypothetical protein [Chryseobacterium sp. T9W2-O]MEC3876338.1 hypothetical protein [Chryseobacterium sp. T9W2-O]